MEILCKKKIKENKKIKEKNKLKLNKTMMEEER